MRRVAGKSGPAVAFLQEPTKTHLRIAKNNLSSLLWGIDWNSFFPLLLEEELRVEVATFADVDAFAKKHFSSIYGDGNNPFRFLEESATRARYYETVADCFLFKDRLEVIGSFVGNPIDWDTYYLRNASFLPTYQGRNLYQRFLSRVWRVPPSCTVETSLDRIEYLTPGVVTITEGPTLCRGTCDGIKACGAPARSPSQFPYRFETNGNLRITLPEDVKAREASPCGPEQKTDVIDFIYQREG